MIITSKINVSLAIIIINMIGIYLAITQSSKKYDEIIQVWLPVQFLGAFFVVVCLLFETLILIISLIFGIIWVTKVLIKKYKERKN